MSHGVRHECIITNTQTTDFTLRKYRFLLIKIYLYPRKRSNTILQHKIKAYKAWYSPTQLRYEVLKRILLCDTPRVSLAELDWRGDSLRRLKTSSSATVASWGSRLLLAVIGRLGGFLEDKIFNFKSILRPCLLATSISDRFAPSFMHLR